MIDDPVAYGAAVPTSALANTEGDEATAARRWVIHIPLLLQLLPIPYTTYTQLDSLPTSSYF